MCQLLGLIYYILRSYDYNMHVEGLLPANFCLVTVLSSQHFTNLKDSTHNTLK